MPQCFAKRLTHEDEQDASPLAPPLLESSIGSDSLRLRLTTRHADAAAALLPLMICGEESASLVFTALHSLALPLPTAPLRSIAVDEQRHERLLEQLRQALPLPPHDKSMQAKLRRFYLSMADRDVGMHFARIVALDSAVCMLLGELRQHGRPLAMEPSVNAILTRIHRDEGRHVRIAREFTGVLIDRARAYTAAAIARDGLAQLLEHRGAALEALQVDPARMLRRLRIVPRRLFV